MANKTFHYKRLDSTNDEAKRLIAAGKGEHGLVIVADTQTHGRGRHERLWISPTGGLFASLVLKSNAPLSRLTALPLVAGLALFHTLLPHADRNALRLKWPNDLLVNEKKVAGILVESIQRPYSPSPYPLPSREGGGMLSFIVGLGVNMSADIPPVASPFTPPTSLSAEDIPVDRDVLLSEWCKQLDIMWSLFEEQGFPPFKQAYLEASKILGAVLRIRSDSETVEGEVLAVEDSGAILVKTENGSELFYSGDLI